MKKFANLIFVVVAAIVLFVLLNAPPVSTPRTPADETHATPKKFDTCPTCHLPGGEAPEVKADHLYEGKLKADHVKCYMCHKEPEE